MLPMISSVVLGWSFTDMEPLVTNLVPQVLWMILYVGHSLARNAGSMIAKRPDFVKLDLQP
jgi:hypothetical protein